MKNENITFNTPYPELNAVLRELVSSAQQALPDNFVAAYLHGSFAVGDFDDHSNVDFVIVIDQDLSDSQLRNVQSMHERIFNLDAEWVRHLEGSYFPTTVLRDYVQSGSELWYLEHGRRVLVKLNLCNTVVVRLILREKGVVLSGADPSPLIEPIAVGILRREILASINKWGQEILADPEEINNRFYQSFAVLIYCRMLHDLHTGVVGPKRCEAEWAECNLGRSCAGRTAEPGCFHSAAGQIGHRMEPIIKPMGFDWKIGTALIGALAAKEVFVAQMGIVYTVEEADQESDALRDQLAAHYSPLAAFYIMLFALISAPCVATIAMTRRESNSWKWALFQLGGLTALAWVVTIATFQLGLLFGIGI